VVSDHHFDAVFEAYLMDPVVRDFLQQVNPNALHDIAARLTEAQERGLWSSRRNDTRPVLAELLSKVSPLSG
jgi:cobaltochelatase CobN